MTPPAVSEDFYNKDDFQFSSLQLPKDEYLQPDIQNRVLSKFIPKFQKINHDRYYSEVYRFIICNIIPNHNELVSCDLAHKDVEGNPDIIFNIKFEGNLSFSKRNSLHCAILEELYNFCVSSDFPFVFDNMSVLLIKSR